MKHKLVCLITMLFVSGCSTFPVSGEVSVAALGGLIDVTVGGTLGDGKFEPEVVMTSAEEPAEEAPQ